MSLVNGNMDPIVRELMKLTGCPEHVRSFEYRAAVGEVTTITIEFLPDISGAKVEDLRRLVSAFRLEKVDSERWPHPPAEEHEGTTRGKVIERQYAHVKGG